MVQNQKTTKTADPDKKIKIGIIIAFAAIAVIISVVLIIAFSSENKTSVNYTIYMEGTEGFEIEVSETQIVSKVTPTAELDFAPAYDSFVGKKLLETVQDLIDSLCDNKVLTNKNNALLISVCGSDTLSNIVVASDLMTLLYVYCDSVDVAVICQPIDNVEEERSLAVEHGVSIGKQMLIDRILNQNKKFTFDELKVLGFEELSLLAHFGINNITYVYQMGTVYQSRYIAMATAQTKALSNVGIGFNEVSNMLTDMAVVDGKLAYEIDFDYNGSQYEYLIDASNADIFDSSVFTDEAYEYHKNHLDETPQEGSGYIGLSRAKSVLLDSIGLEEGKVSELTGCLTHSRGLIVYQVSFVYEDYGYEALINAKTGAIIEYTKKYNA